MVEGILVNFDGDQTPLEIARMFTVPVAAVRKVLAFALTAELLDLLNARLAGRWTRKEAYRFDKLGRSLPRSTAP